MRNALGIPRPLDMLEEIEKLDAQAKQHALRIVEEFEEEGKRRFQLQPGEYRSTIFIIKQRKKYVIWYSRDRSFVTRSNLGAKNDHIF